MPREKIYTNVYINVLIRISKLFETKDGIFVKNARQVSLMRGNLALRTKQKLFHLTKVPFMKGPTYPNKLIELC